MNLDTRARAAAQAVRRSRTRLDPVAGLDNLVRRRRRQPLQRAAAAGLALLVMVVAIWAGVVWRGSTSVQPALGPGRTVAEGTVKVELGRPLTVELSAKEAGDEVYGTAEIISDEGREAFSIDLECAVERNDVLILGGGVSESNMQDPKVGVGTGSAVLVKQGEPDRMLLWFADSPPAGDCDAFARNIAAELPEMLADENAFQPVLGDIETG
jgi:hypothetical protein